MQAFMNAYPTLLLYIGLLDGALVLLLGLVAATFILFDIKAERFFDRVMPAIGVLIGTSVASGIILAATRWLLGFVVATAMLLFSSSAFAASIDIGQAISDSFSQIVLLTISGVVSTIVGWLCVIAKNKFNIDIEARHREAFKAFVDRQAASLVADGSVWLKGVRIEVGNEALAAAANAALSAVPQAREFFGLSDQRIAAMIIDALPKVPSVASAQAIAMDVANPATPSVAPQPVG